MSQSNSTVVGRPDIQPRKRSRPIGQPLPAKAAPPSDRSVPEIQAKSTITRPATKKEAKPVSKNECDVKSPLADKKSIGGTEKPVGYKNPPKHSRFKPGQSGNPKGRPKGARSLQTIVRDLMTQKVPIRTAQGIKKMTHMEALMHKALEQGYAGNLRALTSIMQLYAQSVPNEEVPPLESFDADQSALINQMLSEAGFDSEPVKRKTDRSTPDGEVGA